MLSFTGREESHFRMFSFKGSLQCFLSFFAADNIPLRETKGVNYRLQICELLFEEKIFSRCFPPPLRMEKEEMSVRSSRRDSD